MTGNDSAPRSLADDLRARADDELAALLRARPDLLVPVPADVSQLASRATTRASAVRALDRLDRFTLQVVDALIILPAPVSPAGLRAALGARAAVVDDALGTLRTQALVWGPDDDLRLPRIVHEIVGPHPAGLGPPARQALLALSPSRLASIMAGLGLTPAADHAGNVDVVAAVLTDPSSLTALLDELTDDARSALAALTPGPPTGRIDDALREVHRETARTPIDLLLAVGLLVPVDSTTVVLPREVALQLRGGRVHTEPQPAPPTPPVTERAPDTVDRTAGAGAFDLTRKVELLLDTWAAEPPPVLRTGGLGVRDLRRLPDLLDTDEAGAALIAEAAYAAGLLAVGNADEVWLPTPEFDAWRREDPSRRWAVLAQAWLTTSRVAGLAGSRDEKDRPIPPLGRDLERPAAPEVRRLALEELAGLPAGWAPDLVGVLAALQWRRPRRAGRFRDDLVRWTLREAEQLGLTGMGALASFARPFLEGRSGERAVTAAADAVRSSLPQPLDHVLLQADLTAIAPGPLRADLERELSLLSDVESRGGASVHRFTAGSLRRALDAGRTAADVHAFLATISRTPVPQPLTYLVDDVARTHGQLRVGAASAFVRCDDEAVLAAIMADPRSSSLGLRRLAPTVLASSIAANTLVERLRLLGFSPVPEAADGSIVIGHSEPRRSTTRFAPRPGLAELTAPEETLLGAAVRALRAGDRSRAERPADGARGHLGRTTAATTLADLREALETGTTVWIGYVDQHGATTERLVDPARIDGGWLSAFDHRSGEVRSFAVHRISGVAPVDAA
ncbi:helicase C-terminal domain-containing protein [Jiangella alkaliphila]|uniref:Helicase conserved C-terminal domain-containing protein n=1 Tax=Jiangella alkaliphila TaxID=419479 RepID=A0A1H2ILM6_9ACTN|nr:helicase C-terminal domain-containing protein [Jiangella alkaliphila]SDU44758.1 Helicase conserved C-terminal domain-containing protein [Jiangella alkaliphila]